MEPRTRSDALVAIAGAFVLGIAAGVWFGVHPDRPVLVGTETIDHLVPAHYQASVFPAYGAAVALLGADLLRGRLRASWIARFALLASTSVLACIRLAGALPLSGHVLFLVALLAHEVASRGRSGNVVLWGCAIPALGVASWYKLVVWHDVMWFVVSGVVGVGIGAGCRVLWK